MTARETCEDTIRISVDQAAGGKNSTHGRSRHSSERGGSSNNSEDSRDDAITILGTGLEDGRGRVLTFEVLCSRKVK